jgi:hypothetical protein
LSSINPTRALINALKPFCIWPNNRRKNRQYSISAGSLTPPKQFQRCH